MSNDANHVYFMYYGIKLVFNYLKKYHYKNFIINLKHQNHANLFYQRP